MFKYRPVRWMVALSFAVQRRIYLRHPVADYAPDCGALAMLLARRCSWQIDEFLSTSVPRWLRTTGRDTSDITSANLVQSFEICRSNCWHAIIA